MKLAELTENLQELRLYGMLANFTELGRIAEKERKTYEQYLGLLSELELDIRKRQRVKKLIKEAKLPVDKGIESFDFTLRTGISPQEVQRLAQGNFIPKGGNIVLYGDVGVGKTHLIIGLVKEWCARSYRCLFISTCVLIETLLEAQKNLSLGRLWKKLDRYDMIVCDELGYIPQTRDGADLFFQFISQRYERKSITITTNLAYSEWDKVFLSSITTAAAVDRIIHNCETYSVMGPSWRREEARTKVLS